MVIMDLVVVVLVPKVQMPTHHLMDQCQHQVIILEEDVEFNFQHLSEILHQRLVLLDQ